MPWLLLAQCTSGSTLKTQYSLSGFKDGSVPTSPHRQHYPRHLPCSTAWTGFSKQPTPTHFVSLLQDILQKDINTGHWSFSTGYPDFPDSRLSKSVERYIKNQNIHSQFLDDSSILLNLDAVLNMINPIQPFMLLHSPAFGARRVWKVSTCSPTWKGTSVGHGEAIAWVRWTKRWNSTTQTTRSTSIWHWPKLTKTDRVTCKESKTLRPTKAAKGY